MYNMSRNPENVVPAPWRLRNHRKIRLKIQNPKTAIYLFSPIYRGKALWDELEDTQQNKPSLESFKKSLKEDDR